MIALDLQPIHRIQKSGRWYATSPKAPRVTGEGRTEDEAIASLTMQAALAAVVRRETASAACPDCHQTRAECLCPQARS